MCHCHLPPLQLPHHLSPNHQTPSSPPTIQPTCPITQRPDFPTLKATYPLPLCPRTFCIQYIPLRFQPNNAYRVNSTFLLPTPPRTTISPTRPRPPPTYDIFYPICSLHRARATPSNSPPTSLYAERHSVSNIFHCVPGPKTAITACGSDAL